MCSRLSREWILIASLCLGVCLGVACGDRRGASADPEAVVSAAANVDDSTLAGLLTVAGDGAPLVIVVDDQGWAAARDRLLASFEGETPAELKVLEGTQDGQGVVTALGRSIGFELGDTAWAGHDHTRPVVVSMIEPPFDGPPGAAIAQMSPFDGRHAPIRHQVVIPASDPTVLVQSLRAWAGPEATEVAALVQGMPGAVGLAFKREWPEQRFVALVPQGHHVRVVILDDGRGVTDPGTLRPRIDADVSGLAQTPALKHLVDAEAPLGVLVRPWRLRALGAWAGARDTNRAVDGIRPQSRAMGRAKGMSIAAVIEVLTPDTHAEFDDWSFAVRGGDDLRLTAVASLTPHGREIWRAGQSNTVVPLALKRDVAGEAFVNIDIAAMLAMAPAHELGEGPLSEFATAVQECGVLCPAFAMLRWPLSAVKTTAGPFGGTETIERATGLSAVHVALLSLDPQPQLAAAIIAPPGQPVGEIGELVGERLSKMLQVHAVTRGDSSVLLIGTGVDPRTVFDLSRDRADSAAADALASVVWSQGAPMPPGVRASKLSGTVRLADKAVVAEVVVGAGALEFKPDYGAVSWSSPQQSGPSSTEAECLRNGVDAMRKGLANLAYASDEQTAGVTKTALASLETPLQCARNDKALAPLAELMADMVAIAGAGELAQNLNFAAARRVLELRCNAGSPSAQACERLSQTPKGPVPAIPQEVFETKCLQSWNRGMPLTVSRDEVTVGGQVVDADVESIIEAVMAVTPIRSRLQGHGPMLGLVVDAALPMKRVVPVLEALAATKSTVGIAVVDAAGKSFQLDLPLDWRSKATVDWALDPAYEVPQRYAESRDDGQAEVRKGPAEFTIRLAASGMSVKAADGSSVPISSVMGLDDALDSMPRGQRARAADVALVVADDVVWSKVVDIVATSSCWARLVLTR